MAKELMKNCPYMDCGKPAFRGGKLEINTGNKLCVVTRCPHCKRDIDLCWAVEMTLECRHKIENND